MFNRIHASLSHLSSGFEALIRKVYLWFTLKIMKAVFSPKIWFLVFLSDCALKKKKKKGHS